MFHVLLFNHTHLDGARSRRNGRMHLDSDHVERRTQCCAAERADTGGTMADEGVTPNMRRRPRKLWSESALA